MGRGRGSPQRAKALETVEELIKTEILQNPRKHRYSPSKVRKLIEFPYPQVRYLQEDPCKDLSIKVKSPRSD